MYLDIFIIGGIIITIIIIILLTVSNYTENGFKDDYCKNCDRLTPQTKIKQKESFWKRHTLKCNVCNSINMLW